MNGFELFRELKKIDGSAKVCFLTASDMYVREFDKLFPKTKVEGFLRKLVSTSQAASEIETVTA